MPFILDDAAIAALMAEGAGTAAGGAVTAGGMGSGALGTGLTATELGSATVPTAAEMGGQTAGHLSTDLAPLSQQSPQLPPMQQGGGLGDQVMAPMKKLGELMPNISKTGENLGSGNIGAEIKNMDMGSRLPGNDMMPGAGDIASGLFGGGEAPPMPAPAELPKPPAEPMTPSTPGVPMSMQDKFKTAHDTLRLASLLVNNKKDKQTLGFMSLGTALASNGGDMSKSMSTLQGPVSDIAGGVEQPKEPKPISPLAAPPPPVAAPTEKAPSASRSMGDLPPVSLMDPRLRSTYGG